MNEVTQKNKYDYPGSQADSPTEFEWSAWKASIKRIYQQVWNDQIMMLAAGVAFYGFLSFIPLLGSVLSIYGLLSDPWTVESSLGPGFDLLPSEGLALIQDQLKTLSSQETKTLGWATAISLLISLWSAGAGTSALIDAICLAYEEKETRSFVKLRGLAILFTIGFFIFGAICFTLLAAIPAFFDKLGFPYSTDLIVSVGRWPLLALVMTVWIGLLYRFAPDRSQARWRWLSVGSVCATLIWLAGSALLSLYAEKMGDLNATYGSLTGVIVFLLWLYLSALSILLGAEINAELEHQTARDSTVGPEKPLGERGAIKADIVPQM